MTNERNCAFRVFVDGRPRKCGAPGTVRVYGVNCRICEEFTGSLVCTGHTCCDTHGMAVRTEKHEAHLTKPDWGTFELARIHSLVVGGEV